MSIIKKVTVIGIVAKKVMELKMTLEDGKLVGEDGYFEDGMQSIVDMMKATEQTGSPLQITIKRADETFETICVSNMVIVFIGSHDTHIVRNDDNGRETIASGVFGL